MKEALKLALEALEMYCEHGAILRPLETRDALKEALAKQEHDEPVAIKVWTDAQHERAYRNSPELHKDVQSLAAFKRVAKAVAAMYGIAPQVSNK